VTRIPIGTYHVTSNFTVAKASWDSLSAQEKEWLVAAAARANFDLTDRWAYQLPAAAMDAVKKTGIEVIEPDPAFLEASNAFISEDEAARVAQGGEMAQHFVDLVAKWTAIVNEVGEDPDKLAERANAEIWSKVDWAKYGG
jgi:TRAP-type C4-dicarboxylate transport system substrate-binding protein